MTETRAATPARAADRMLGFAFALLVAALLTPWPRPTVSLLAACDLQPAGRTSLRCDLEAAAARSGRGWLKQGLAVYEDGIALRAADRERDARREHPASFHTDGQVLTFSALDRSDPRTNGHQYVARPAEYDPLRGQRPLAWASLVAAFALACWRRGPRRAELIRATALSIGLVLLAVQVAIVLEAQPVHVDTGETLGAAEAIARGAVPYKTLAYDLYTPLGAYQLGYWSRLWPGPQPVPLPFYLAWILAAWLACATLVWRLLRDAGVEPFWATLCAVSYLSMTLWFDGGRILHEPLYLVFVLAAAWLVSRADVPSRFHFGAGALAAVAFMVKQYGGVGLAGLTFATLLAGRERWRRLALIVAGWASGLALCLGVLWFDGADPRVLVAQALGPRYPRKFELVWFELFFWQCPLALLALLTPFTRGAWSTPIVRLAVGFLAAACLPFLIRQHQYYFLVPAPWLFVLFALGVHFFRARQGWLRPAASVLAVVLFVSIPWRAVVAQGPLSRSDWRGRQLRHARLMTLAWPAVNRTMVLGQPSFYYLTGYASADEAQLGYMFLNGQSAARLQHGLRSAQGLWIDPRGMYARGVDNELKTVGSSLSHELEVNGFERRVTIEDRLELWTR